MQAFLKECNYVEKEVIRHITEDLEISVALKPKMRNISGSYQNVKEFANQSKFFAGVHIIIRVQRSACTPTQKFCQWCR